MKVKVERLAIVLTAVLAATSLVCCTKRKPSGTPPVATPTTVPACGVHCGTERWAVKTLTDADHAKVDYSAKEQTVAELVSQARPLHLPSDGRVEPVETRTYRVRANLVGFKWERDGDQDFHIVIADLDEIDKTMIVEIPDPDCAGVCASDHKAEIQKAREDFIVHCGQPSRSFRQLHGPLTVVVTGVGFFDFPHGQTGVAENGIELHPVLEFEFPDSTDQCAQLASSSQ
jgi:hypothetical protein